MNTPTSPKTWAERVHEAHVRLEITLPGNCAECRKDDRPEWVRRAQAHRLPAWIRGGVAR